MAPTRNRLLPGFPASYADCQSFGLVLRWLSVPTSHEQFVLYTMQAFVDLHHDSHEVSKISIPGLYEEKIQFMSYHFKK